MPWTHCFHSCRLPLVLSLVLAGMAHAQLAITEVMPVARLNTNTWFRGAEYWELTNFGTNEVNLHGYGFRDSNPARTLVKSMFTNLVVGAGESVIFFRIEDEKQSVTNLAQFRAWWGESNVPVNLQCRTWKGSPGLSGWDGDDVWLFDAAGNVVDRVQFARMRPGRAFTYERESGLFGVSSSASVDGAFAAELADDIGSPGITSGSVAVSFLQQPGDETIDAGAAVSFTAIGAGMPQPRYQWFGNDLAIANATGPTLVLSNVQSAHAGAYGVVISNGLTGSTSVVATLTVNTNPVPPSVVTPPVNATVFDGQTAVFSVAGRGLPAPVYQWSMDGVAIQGAVGPKLEIANVTRAMSGRNYSVRMWNDSGSTNLSASLTVVHRPDLRFTELMALPSIDEDNLHFDWFELTNFDTNAVDLRGWRFSDEPSFARAITISNALTLQPGESAIFAERLDGLRFGAWWGSNSLPEGLQVYTYSGFGLAAFGEVLFLWNPAARDPYDSTATVSWARATPGVSFECERFCDPGFGCVDEAMRDSVPGVRGAFRAAEGGHVGSPGYVDNPPVRIVSINRSAADAVTLCCRVAAGRTYRLYRAAALANPNWIPLQTGLATNNVLTFSDQVSPSESTWFYRIEQLP